MCIVRLFDRAVTCFLSITVRDRDRDTPGQVLDSLTLSRQNFEHLKCISRIRVRRLYNMFLGILAVTQYEAILNPTVFSNLSVVMANGYNINVVNILLSVICASFQVLALLFGVL